MLYEKIEKIMFYTTMVKCRSAEFIVRCEIHDCKVNRFLVCRLLILDGILLALFCEPGFCHYQYTIIL